MRYLIAASLLIAAPALAEWPKPTPEQMARFEAADIDGSGRVDLAEAQAVWPGLTQREMQVHDATPDGALDVYEFITVRMASPVVEPED